MDTGVFQDSPISQIEFEPGPGIRRIPLPDELPPPPATNHLPKDILKSATVENLISQNEDLMARLKVALRRLNVIETENAKLRRTAEESVKRAAVVEDQALVLREKDQVWKEKVSGIERNGEVLKEKVRVLGEKLQAAVAELEKAREFKEHIRTEVKPHMIELREYARGLEEKIAALEGDLGRREGQVRDLREQIIEVTKNSRFQIETAESRVHELISSYEATIHSQREELEHSRRAMQDLEIKATKLPRVEQRCDELENEIIELRRNKEELSVRFETECRRLSERAESMAGENGRLKMENEDLSAKVMSDYDRLRELEKQVLDQQSQMESLRYLYTSRTEENEKLKLSLAALDRLNVDLSARVQELRQSPEAGSAPSTAG